MTQYILFEHAAGYALFKTDNSEIDEETVHKSASDLNTFKSLCTSVAFQPFKTGRDALENINCVSESLLHSQLEEFLDSNLPKKKRKKISLGVAEAKLGVAIAEKLEINCESSSLIHELIRGIRFHFSELIQGLEDSDVAKKSQLGLGHSYSRARVKFNVNRIDNMIIQSINVVDQLDKDINNFIMRVREWYSHHFPELIKYIPDNMTYIQCVRAIRDRKALPENVEEELEKILNDPVKVQNVIDLAKNSMGMDISEFDLENVYFYAERAISLTQRRQDVMDYLKSKMHNIAPNLASLLGEVVGARLISHAGSLTNLAKAPASTVQILGAEKALFRALKTRGNTPKYGLLYHSKFISKAGKTNKGRISRYLANKCSVASRIDCFRDLPTEIFGDKLKEQVESRLKFYETGEIPKKNVDIMTLAMQEAEEGDSATLKQMKKAKKKAKKEKLRQSLSLTTEGEEVALGETEPAENVAEPEIKKKKKKRKHSHLEREESMTEPQELMQNGEPEEESIPKKKKKKHLVSEDAEESGVVEMNGILENGDDDVSVKKKKKKKRKTNDMEFPLEMD